MSRTKGSQQFAGRRSGGQKHAWQQRMLTKLIKDKDAKFRPHDLNAFLQGMNLFDSKSELLLMLTDSRNCGEARLRECLSMIDGPDSADSILAPILLNIMTAETSRPLHKARRKMAVIMTYNVPGLIQFLSSDWAGCIDSSSTETARIICQFLIEATLSLVEARCSEDVATIAKSMNTSTNIDTSLSNKLCAIIQLDKPDQKVEPMNKVDADVKTAVCWGADLEPPGGRHDNDHPNYRDISLVPTKNELAYTGRSWLPLASGENRCVNDLDQCLLDKNFRLLREDAVGAMRENIVDPRPSKVWNNARIIGASCADFRNPKGTAPLHFLVQVDPRQGRSINWQRQRVLPQDGLVVFDDGQQHIMATIFVRKFDEPRKWLHHSAGPIFGVLFHHDNDVQTAIKDVYVNTDINDRLQDIFRDHEENKDEIIQLKSCFKTYNLIEVSDSFFSYRPVLMSLQNMVSVPLSREIVHIEAQPERPDYLPRIVTLPSDFANVQVDLDAWSNQSVMQSTTLDESQSKALGMALTSRVALIQGPPGTGKTFIGSLIAQVIRDNSDESILCVCYTNHALDQFLEHMLKRGEKKLVRIGGRTKSETLKNYELKALSRKEKSLSVSNADQRMRSVVAQMHGCKEEITKLLETLQMPLEWEHAQDILEAIHYSLTLNFKTDQDDGFALIGRNNAALKEKDLFNAWKRGEDCPEWLQEILSWEEEHFENLWLLLPAQRLERLNEWKAVQFEEVNGMIQDARQRYESLSAEKADIGMEIDSNILQQARIIGATTTGAAKYRDLLSLKSASVVIVEEAGEVLEPHVLTSLTEDKDGSEETKHLILIGDHMQLRPKLESYSLTRISGNGFDFDVSLFERLIRSGFDSVALGVQHRMRPCFADIIRRQTYPSLKDHPSVETFPDVRGVQDNLLFIDHTNLENGADDHATTKSNTFEAQFCVEIVRYLLLQGYAHNQVTILTPYVGQILEITKEISRSMGDVNTFVSELDQAELSRDGVDLEHIESQEKDDGDKRIRCSSIDNYQGEECDIIVISLVRSNKYGGIGFLKEEQRVNVLLSRAKHGMFIVGNTATLRSSSKGRHVWEPLLEMFQSQGRIVSSFPTICQLHPTDGATKCLTVQDFRTQRPNGGCTRPCNARLKCGHACPLMCHPTDQGHLIIHMQCAQPCKRIPPSCPRNHPCTKLCREECGKCVAKVEDTLLPCGHIAVSPTCDSVKDDSSKKKLSKKCKENVMHTFAACGHVCKTVCSNANAERPNCPELCNETLECGHQCQQKCGSCESAHSCKQKCERTLFCGHICGSKCHGTDPCPPCDKKCPVSCVHSECGGKCRNICSSCVEDCDWQCVHQGQCDLVCGAPCNRLPCNFRCDKLLPCGHRCPSICGEDCPGVSFCVECCPAGTKENIVDMLEFNSYEDQDLDIDPVIFLQCGHFYSVSTLDGIMEIDKCYERDGEGNFIGLKDLSSTLGMSKPKSCPDCRKAINHIKRYGRLTSFMRLRFLERKHMTSIEMKLKKYSLNLEAWTSPEDNSNEAQVQARVRRLLKSLEDLEKDVENGPMKIVFEACRGKDVVVSSPPTRPYLQLMRLRAQCFTRLVMQSKDENYINAINVYQRSIEYADADRSRYISSMLRLDLCKLQMNWNALLKVRSEVNRICDRIIADNINAAVVQEAIELKEKCNNDELKEVLRAMNKVSGYDYGGGWSSHWYECPNGHPYFIGECGGAMELGTCNECGEQIGGRSHALVASNRSSTLVAEALRD